MRNYKRNFKEINNRAQQRFPALVNAWLPNGVLKGCNYYPLNPRRDDKHPGSFLINIKTTQWIDFATGDKGVGAISLYSYIKDLSVYDAAVVIDEIIEGVWYGK